MSKQGSNEPNLQYKYCVICITHHCLSVFQIVWMLWKNSLKRKTISTHLELTGIWKSFTYPECRCLNSMEPWSTLRKLSARQVLSLLQEQTIPMNTAADHCFQELGYGLNIAFNGILSLGVRVEKLIVTLEDQNKVTYWSSARAMTVSSVYPKSYKQPQHCVIKICWWPRVKERLKYENNSQVFSFGNVTRWSVLKMSHLTLQTLQEAKKVLKIERRKLQRRSRKNEEFCLQSSSAWALGLRKEPVIHKKVFLSGWVTRTGMRQFSFFFWWGEECNSNPR